MNSIPCFSIKLVPNYYLINIEENTAKHLELLCEEYSLTDEELISQALRLAEVNMAEFEARKTAAFARGCYES